MEVANVRPVGTTPINTAFKGSLLKNGEDKLRQLTQADLAAPQQDVYAGGKKKSGFKKLLVLAALATGAVLLVKGLGVDKIKATIQPIIDKIKGVAQPVVDKGKEVVQKTINK